MSKRVNISDNQLRELYQKQKLTTYQIANKLNCCQATIWKRLVKFNITRRTPYELNSNVPSKEKLIKFYTHRKLSTWQIEKKYGYCRGTIHRKLKEFGITTRDRADSHIVHPRKDFSGDLIEKAYLIGFRIGDLGIRKIWPNSKTICVASGSTIKEQIDLIESLFKDYGKVRIKTTKSNKTNIWVALNESFDFLLSKEVPTWIIRSKKYFISFLAGFIDAEGNVGIYNSQAKLQIGNYDKYILDLITKKLNGWGIICRGPYENDTSNYVHCEGYPYNKNYFQVCVNRKDSLLRLFAFLEPHIKHKNKIKDLKKARHNILKRNKIYGERRHENKELSDKHGN